MIYEDAFFLSKVMGKTNSYCLVRCLDNPYGINLPLEGENDAVQLKSIQSINKT